MSHGELVPCAPLIRPWQAASRRIGEVRLALLQEVGDALDVVFRLHAELELGIGNAKRLAKGLEHRAPYLRLHHRERAWRYRLGDRSGVGLHVLAERDLRKHLVDEAHLERL